MFILQERLPAVDDFFSLNGTNEWKYLRRIDFFFFLIKLVMVFHGGWKYSSMANRRMYLQRVMFKLWFCAINFTGSAAQKTECLFP